MQADGKTLGIAQSLLTPIGILLIGFVAVPFVIYGLAPGIDGSFYLGTNFGVLLASQAVVVASVFFADRSVFGCAERGLKDILAIGACAFFAIVVAAFLVFTLSVWTGFDTAIPADVIHGGVWFTLAALVIGAPLSEELLFRGLLFPDIARGFGPIHAAIISGALWTSIHTFLPGHMAYSGAVLVALFLMGMILAWARYRSGSIWPGVLAHAMYNALPALRILS